MSGERQDILTYEVLSFDAAKREITYRVFCEGFYMGVITKHASTEFKYIPSKSNKSTRMYDSEILRELADKLDLLTERMG